MNHKKDHEPFDQFRLEVYNLVEKIPRGRVMTYGGIASKISKPTGIDPLSYRRIRARWVGYAMKSCPENMPWWRVVNKQGRISLRSGHGPHIQPELLRDEGVVFDNDGKISLDQYLWEPD
jgi:methylated-DNA-protein-cysteine methyltransferase-like protein